MIELFVGGIPKSCDESDLVRRFASAAGEKVQVRLPPAASKASLNGVGSLPTDGVTNNGYCFVGVSSHERAANLVKTFHNTRWAGRKLVVEKASVEPKSVLVLKEPEKPNIRFLKKQAQLQRKAEAEATRRAVIASRKSVRIRKRKGNKSKLITVKQWPQELKGKLTSLERRDQENAKSQQDKSAKLITGKTQPSFSFSTGKTTTTTVDFTWKGSTTNEDSSWLTDASSLVTQSSFLLQPFGQSSPKHSPTHASVVVAEEEEEKEDEDNVVMSSPEEVDENENGPAPKGTSTQEEEQDNQEEEEEPLGEFQWRGMRAIANWLARSGHELQSENSFVYKESVEKRQDADSSSEEE
eukprot:TRINITY_DN9625_c0_g1_i1.p1 TRINITY_DN9625_c0_g1~~TRINITY_DN9625_c0_g1_i1.p1  ORF type:complete len:354 (-),score=85.63 TRINITY_DN9625_c0_g1_i1:91-1152(-)